MSFLSKMYGGPDDLESRQTMAYQKSGCWKNSGQLKITYISSGGSTPQ